MRMYTPLSEFIDSTEDKHHRKDLDYNHDNQKLK
jgi:hypothetical protein